MRIALSHRHTAALFFIAASALSTSASAHTLAARSAGATYAGEADPYKKPAEDDVDDEEN